MTNHSSAKSALVVEDDESTRDFLVMALTKLGYEVDAVEDGMMALDRCSVKSFEVVVCDIRLPRLSGLSFVRNIRARSPDAAKYVVFVSAMDDTVVRREAQEMGATAFLYKPITMDSLREAIEKAKRYS